MFLFCSVFSVIVFAAMNIGESSSLAPDFAKAKTSAKRILDLLEKSPEIDIYSDKGEKPVSGTQPFRKQHQAFH